MQIDGYTESLREDLARLAALGDESVARAAELMSVALEPALRQRLQEALAEAAVELSAHLDAGSVEVRLSGGDTELVFVPNPARDAEPVEDPSTARITLRLPEALKAQVEAAAARAGVSVNTWVIQSLNQATTSRRQEIPGRNRLTGYGRS
jgi:hypothetical protein